MLNDNLGWAQTHLCAINEVTNQVFVVTYGNNSVVVLDGATDTILDIKSSGGFGAWGLAVNPTLNRLYVSNRDTGSVTTLDGANGFQVINSQTIAPCGSMGSSPYGLGFNPNNAKLYIACAPGQISRKWRGDLLCRPGWSVATDLCGNR